MARFIIHGNKRLSGTFQPAGNKNAALPMLAACLLTNEDVVLHNVPLISDVFTMLEILSDLGVAVDIHEHTVKLRAEKIRKRRLNQELCHKVRASILFAGAMIAQHKEIKLYPPGGDVIGRRRLDTHLLGLQALGIEITTGNQFSLRRNKLRGADILLDEASVTATENIMMAASLAEGTTTVFNAACEPHVQDLGRLLNKMGARISGLGTNLIKIKGVQTLHGTVHSVCLDHIEIGSFIAAAAVTGGELTIKTADPDAVAPIMYPFQTLGMKLRFTGNLLKLPSAKHLRVRNEFDTPVPTIEDGPWPSFPSDLMSVAIVACTQADGTVLFFEKMFESRMYFVDRLIDMGARIVQCDPHRVLVAGSSKLKAINVSGPDIRAGMAVVIAALCADGTSIIDNAQVVDRGYESIEKRLQNLGADIIRE